MAASPPATGHRILHAYVSGSVQGVFFRVHTRNQADSLHLTGVVKNLPDRRVEVLAEGPESDLKTLLEWLHIGPSGPPKTPREPRVDSVEFSWIDNQPKKFDAFYIDRGRRGLIANTSRGVVKRRRQRPANVATNGQAPISESEEMTQFRDQLRAQAEEIRALRAQAEEIRALRAQAEEIRALRAQAEDDRVLREQQAEEIRALREQIEQMQQQATQALLRRQTQEQHNEELLRLVREQLMQIKELSASDRQEREIHRLQEQVRDQLADSRQRRELNRDLRASVSRLEQSSECGDGPRARSKRRAIDEFLEKCGSSRNVEETAPEGGLA